MEGRSDRSPSRGSVGGQGIGDGHRFAGKMAVALRGAWTMSRNDNGAVAQLVAHLHGMQGVRGSSPLSSTKQSDKGG